MSRCFAMRPSKPIEEMRREAEDWLRRFPPGPYVATVTDRPGLTRGQLAAALGLPPPDDADVFDHVAVEYKLPNEDPEGKLL